MNPAPDFFERWEASGAAERANYQLFLSELCDLIGVPRPEPTRPDDSDNAYVFERNVTFQNPGGTTSTGRIDLYKRGCFVLEAKQGSDRAEPSELLAMPKRARRGTAVRGTAGWDEAMVAARGQADQYVRALPASEPNPPFILVVDVGHTLEVYSDFTRQGRTYVPFPDALTHRIPLRDLAREDVRERLRLVWTDPLELDPSRRSAKVTKEVAERLAKLAKLLEASGHAPDVTAQFLMRCLFTFFAEDVGLLPKDGFTNMLRDLRDRGKTALFPEKTRSLWETMRTGTPFSPILEAKILRFNGGLFESADALALTDDQLALMVEAGERGWRDVEPAIFGTLLERALNPVERHKLGAHYTPRAYVERLVMPTVIDPLRDEWANIKAAAVTLANEDDLPEARDVVRGFLRKLCDTIVLDPACGTGNFLYVTLEHMKRLEGEILDTLRGFGETQEAFEGFGLTIDPHQFRGIEINPRAAAIADLVIWIGYLQWHFRTKGNTPPTEPIIQAYKNIECRDAILSHDGAEPLRDNRGNIVTRWDGRTMKRHPLTGEEVPHDTAKLIVLNYINPRKAEWPKADYIVGNPPFVGKRAVRMALGDGYVEAIRKVWTDLPDAADFVMHWWHQSAELVEAGSVRRFGLITTNSIRQPFNMKVVSSHLGSNGPLHLAFAMPDSPWVDSTDGAAVRVSSTVAAKGIGTGLLLEIVDEKTSTGVETAVFRSRSGTILPDLTIGPELDKVVRLRSNLGICAVGFQLNGQGFVLTAEQASSMGRGLVPEVAKLVRPLLNGKDISQTSRGLYAIDLEGLGIEEINEKHPKIYQWILERVKPERDHNSERSRREKWWLFGRSNQELRNALVGLSRFIGGSVTSRHRVFTYFSSDTILDSTSFAIAIEDAEFMGVLSSRVHVLWAYRVGTNLGVGNDHRYNKSVCFETFAFPEFKQDVRGRIIIAADLLDAHRKARQAENPTLTLTGMYNVLAKLRSGEPLTDKERVIHEQGLVSVLKQIHDDLDAAVFDAYGWPHNLTDEEILTRLVALNRERAEEEANGRIRWLRPEYQNPGGTIAPTARQGSLPIAEPEPTPTSAKAAKKPAWPKTLPEQAQAVRATLAATPAAMTPTALAKTFQRGPAPRVAELLDTLVSLGQARALRDGTYVRS